MKSWGVLVVLIFLTICIMGCQGVYVDRSKARTATCMNNVKQLNLSFLQYCQDYDEKFPPKEIKINGKKTGWCDMIEPYIPTIEILKCPELPGSKNSYGMNKSMSGISLERIKSPAETVLLFDAKNGGWNLYGGETLLDFRHEGGVNIGFVDGHVKGYQHSGGRPNILW